MLVMNKLMVSIVCFCVLLCSFPIWADTATECNNLAKEVNSDLRSIDRIRDADAALSKLTEVKSKIEKIRSLDPNFSQINILESKYKRLYRMYGGSEEAKAEAPPPVDNRVKEQALKDWEAIVQLKKEFVTELETVIPTYVKNVIYSESNVDEVVAKIHDLHQRIPEITAFLKDFSSQYGDSREEIDNKLTELTPKDPSAGMYDPVNQRPSDSGGRCYETLVQGLTNLEEAPRIEAKRILTQALQQLDHIESFFADTYRDQKYSEVEAKIQMGLKFNPDDQELIQWAQKIPELRQKSKEDIEKTLDQATFPDHMTGFTGPGNVDQLSASIIQYWALLQS